MTPANKGQRYDKDVLTREEVRLLLDVAAPAVCRGSARRTRALLAFLYRTGCRLNEALSLRACDLALDQDSGTGVARILKAKGGKQRTVGVDNGCVELLEAWLRERAQLPGIRDTDPVFCTGSRRKWPAANVRRLLPKLAREAGIGRRVHAHMFRHSYAYERAVCDGAPVPRVQKELGHSNLATTAIYLDHLGSSDVVDGMKGREW